MGGISLFLDFGFWIASFPRGSIYTAIMELGLPKASLGWTVGTYIWTLFVQTSRLECPQSYDKPEILRFSSLKPHSPSKTQAPKTFNLLSKTFNPLKP